MPEQSEWTNDSGDYRWHPNYVRQAVESLRGEQQYDTRTVGEQVDELRRKVVHLEAIVHRYINRTEGD